MNDMERRKFEDSFKDAFREAEFTPSERVWTNVELDLEKASGNKMKRRILFYKLLAAASIAFAMAAVSMNYYGVFNGADVQNLAHGNKNDGTKTSSIESSTSEIKGDEEAGIEDANTIIDDETAGISEVSGDQVVVNSQAESSAVASDVTKEKSNSANGIALNSQAAHTAKVGKQNEKILDERNNASRGNVAAINKNASEAKRKSDAASADRSESIAQSRSKQNRKASAADKDNTTVANNTNVSNRDGVNQAVAGVTDEQNGDEQRKLKPRTKAGVQDDGKTVADSERNSSHSNVRKSESMINSEAVAAVEEDKKNLKHKDVLPQEHYVLKSESGASITSSGQQEEQFVSIQNNKLPPLVKKQTVVFVDPRTTTADPFQVMMARLNDQERATTKQGKDKKSDKNSETLWTSVAFAAGNFNTVNGRVSSSESNAFAVNSIANQQAKAAGSAYSVGLSLGTKISERWVVQGGVNYMTQSSDYTASGVIGSADNSTFSVATVEQLDALFSAPKSASAANAKYVPTASYGITSSLEFISVPVQAGYLVVNKKVGVQVNAGVSTDLFLQNTLATNGEGIKETTQGSGDDSPYRTVNFSGLFGTEVSYRLGTHYRLALNPGIRYPLNSIYKSDIGIEATPLTFDVGVKFRYIFR